MLGAIVPRNSLGNVDRVILRVAQGHVLGDREAEFVDICRRQIADGARERGLMGFLPGYRRVAGADRFVLASTWTTPDEMTRVAGEADRPLAAENLRGVAELESVDLYELREPVFEGILDTPGAVLRFTTATIREGRHDEWLSLGTSRLRQLVDGNLLLGWMVGVREGGDGGMEAALISAWPSPLVIEALTEPGQLITMFATTDRLMTDVRVEHFQAIELLLPDELGGRSTRRVVAARFNSRAEAQAARDGLLAIIADALDAPISVAPLGTPGRPQDPGEHVLVARIALAEYGRVERLIADHGGQMLLAANEGSSS